MRSWAVGASVCVALGEEKVRGQVWALAEPGWVWVVLDNGRCVAVNTRSGCVRERPAGASAKLGRVA